MNDEDPVTDTVKKREADGRTAISPTSPPPTEKTRFTTLDGADLLVVYFMRRRDVLIAELRAIDRLLGRPQTVPVKREVKEIK